MAKAKVAWILPVLMSSALSAVDRELKASTADEGGILACSIELLDREGRYF